MATMEERITRLEERTDNIRDTLTRITDGISKQVDSVREDLRELPHQLAPVIRNEVRDEIDRHSYNCKKKSNPPYGTKRTEVVIPMNILKIIGTIIAALGLGTAGALGGVNIAQSDNAPYVQQTQQAKE